MTPLLESASGPRFAYAIARTLAFEGNELTNDPADPGGLTRYGISRRSHPDVDIASLTRAGAEAIYHRDYWLPEYERIESVALAAKVFDLAVLCGHTQAHRMFQRALRSTEHVVAEDGILGPKTLAASGAAPPFAVLAALRSEAAGYFRTLTAQKPALRRFSGGWEVRAYA